MEGISVALGLLWLRLLEDELVNLAIRCHLGGDLDRARRQPRLTAVLPTARLLMICRSICPIITCLDPVAWCQVVGSRGLDGPLGVCHVVILILDDIRLSITVSIVQSDIFAFNIYLDGVLLSVENAGVLLLVAGLEVLNKL